MLVQNGLLKGLKGQSPLFRALISSSTVFTHNTMDELFVPCQCLWKLCPRVLTSGNWIATFLLQTGFYWVDICPFSTRIWLASRSWTLESDRHGVQQGLIFLTLSVSPTPNSCWQKSMKLYSRFNPFQNSMGSVVSHSTHHTVNAQDMWVVIIDYPDHSCEIGVQVEPSGPM